MSKKEELEGGNQPQNDKKDVKDASGLDAWNDRLDENLETENLNNPLADEKSKDFFENNENLND